MSSMVTPIKPATSPVFHEALQRKKILLEAQNNGGRKAVIQLLFAILCLYDANHMVLVKLVTSHPAQVASSLLYLVEMAMFAILLTSSLSSIWTKFSLLHNLAPISLTAKQFRLLRLDQQSQGFTKSPETSKSPSSPSSPVISGPLVSANMSMTPVNMSGHSWMSGGGQSPTNVTPPPPPTNTNLLSGQFPNSPTSPVTNTSQLAAYLASYSQWEASNGSILDSQDTASQSSQPQVQWQGGHGYMTRGQLDFSPSVSGGPGGQSRPLYQLSSPLPATMGQTSSTDHDQTQDKAQNKVLSHRLGIDPMELVSWNENLRVWLTQTILRPLVSEIDRINTTLPRLGISDVTVGTVPVDRLRKVSALPQVI